MIKTTTTTTTTNNCTHLSNLCLGGAKSPGSLLVHFGSRSAAVDGEVEPFHGPDEVNKPVNVPANAEDHVLHGQSLCHLVVLRVGAVVDDAIHVEVEVVELWQSEVVLRDRVVDQRIPLTKPFVETGDPHGCGVLCVGEQSVQ